MAMTKFYYDCPNCCYRRVDFRMQIYHAAISKHNRKRFSICRPKTFIKYKNRKIQLIAMCFDKGEVSFSFMYSAVLHKVISGQYFLLFDIWRTYLLKLRIEEPSHGNLDRGGIFFYFSTLFHLPPLRFHYAGGCWDRTQDCCDFGIGSQTL
jgi:hypothetical protein